MGVITGKAKSINYKRQVLGGKRPKVGKSISVSASNNTNSFIWGGSTSDATETEIYLNGVSGARYSVEEETQFLFNGSGYIYDSDNDYWLMLTFDLFLIRDDSDNTSIKAYKNDIINIETNLDGTYIQFRADDTNETLNCYVKGLPGTNINYYVVLNRLG